mmetsp:Transcript_3772/g.7733  ORF Transcript_3772/g.7733 Transcript_3772/m.7733 type:complete len:247 (+) Transcript_3772:1276-2016(+)
MPSLLRSGISSRRNMIQISTRYHHGSHEKNLDSLAGNQRMYHRTAPKVLMMNHPVIVGFGVETKRRAGLSTNMTMRILRQPQRGMIQRLERNFRRRKKRKATRGLEGEAAAKPKRKTIPHKPTSTLIRHPMSLRYDTIQRRAMSTPRRIHRYKKVSNERRRRLHIQKRTRAPAAMTQQVRPTARLPKRSRRKVLKAQNQADQTIPRSTSVQVVWTSIVLRTNHPRRRRRRARRRLPSKYGCFARCM